MLCTMAYRKLDFNSLDARLSEYVEVLFSFFFTLGFLPERKFSSELYKSSWKIDVDAYRSWLDIPESDCCRKLMIKDERCDKGCFICANILNSFVFTWITSAWFVKAVSFALVILYSVNWIMKLLFFLVFPWIECQVTSARKKTSPWAAIYGKSWHLISVMLYFTCSIRLWHITSSIHKQITSLTLSTFCLLSTNSAIQLDTYFETYC